MRRAFVVVGEKLSGTWCNDGALVILASECLYRLNVSELGYRDEFDFVVGGVAYVAWRLIARRRAAT